MLVHVAHGITVVIKKSSGKNENYCLIKYFSSLNWWEGAWCMILFIHKNTKAWWPQMMKTKKTRNIESKISSFLYNIISWRSRKPPPIGWMALVSLYTEPASKLLIAISFIAFLYLETLKKIVTHLALINENWFKVINAFLGLTSFGGAVCVFPASPLPVSPEHILASD